MTPTPSLPVDLQGPPISSAVEYLTKNTPPSAPPSSESSLLQAIRVALRGSDTELLSSIQSTSFISTSDKRECQLTWDAQNAIISYGGVMFKKWDLKQEGQSIQWACLGEIELYNDFSSPHGAAHYTSSDSRHTDPGPSSGRPTFGPFARAHTKSKHVPGSTALVPAVFVFLRSIGKIFLHNGFEYTFSLPFIVRKAWPISPHGVMIQRVLEPGELTEAEASGDAVLPTIFSITSPFAEASAVGLTSGILGVRGEAPLLKDEDENSSSPLKSIPPTEMIVWASHKRKSSPDDVVVTVDVEKRQLSVWRYVYIKPKDIPVPLGQAATRANGKKRQSMSAVGTRRTSTIFPEPGVRTDRRHPLSPKTRSRDPSPTPDFFEIPEMPPLSSLPGMAPTLSTTTTMQSLVSGGSSNQWSQQSQPVKGRRNSLTRNDLSVTMDRMVLGGRMDSDLTLTPIEHGRMKAAYWMEGIYSQEIPEIDALSWRGISVCLFDSRWDGNFERSLMSICLPKSQSMLLFYVSYDINDKLMKIRPVTQIPAIAATSINATRLNIADLLFVKPDGQLALLTHGTHELPLVLRGTLPVEMNSSSMDMDTNLSQDLPRVVSVQEALASSTVLTFGDGRKAQISIDMIPKDRLTLSCLTLLSLTLPAEPQFNIHMSFLEYWAAEKFSRAEGMEFSCYAKALYTIFGIDQPKAPPCSNKWANLSRSSSHARFHDDIALRGLKLPYSQPPPPPRLSEGPPHPLRALLAPLLYTLHHLGEALRLIVFNYDFAIELAPVICRIAMRIRPEWADYWKRLVPDAMYTWPMQESTDLENLDDRLPVWPPDMSAILYGRVSTPDWKVPLHDMKHIAARFQIDPSFEYGRVTPVREVQEISMIYQCLADSKPGNVKRAQNAILTMVSRVGGNFVDHLPLGIAAPIREAARTCQLAPPGDWHLHAYKAIGRQDLAASANNGQELSINHGYRPRKDFMNPRRRATVADLVTEARAAASGEVDVVSGVELNLEDFTDIRFGQDRRLEEVARMLCSSSIPTIKMLERPELSEHDQSKEYQNQVVRVAERTMAQPYGRALFTFGSIPTVTREAYNIPKLEYTVRVQPLNTTVMPEPGKLAPDSLSWAEFHNGVAAGLRISPYAAGVESSWIAFNKPSELTPEHAGFLLGLGLTGHLKEMLTWHTFSYLTPKHDLTSIGVLLGLSAANVGTGNEHVTKLLAVHTPALLPTPTVDLNVSLLTQAAGLAGVGLLYLGTKNRRMAEVCLNQISRRDLVQPDLSNEHREAYTYAAALAFGMIMLGKGTTIPADMMLLSRLSILVHGDPNAVLGKNARTSFDINLTSPAAAIALGLMFLRTERQDIADILTIPDTIIALNRIQPSFLLIRTIARNLIMWNSIAPTNEWLVTQIPESIRNAMDRKSMHKEVDDSMELAYYNILAGCCFVVGLKYAGTASQEAYVMVVRYFDLFSRLVYSNGPAFDHKIKRSAVRDGLNLISIALSMVMAGTGEISCLRRLRYAYGVYQNSMYQHGFKYGVHVATYQAMGLLFLGGGRFTLGSSDAAIACLVAAFFPRFHLASSDNKSFLQALRHLWVLAVEPRCLVARDVDTGEVVYLPVKITVTEGGQEADTQLISPTLIPDVDKITRVRVDTPRYWPFYLDTQTIPKHRESLLKSQTLFVKRRTAFLSYTEDPRGSRSLFVRSGSSAGDAATLDFPQLRNGGGEDAAMMHPASDLSGFITSFSNDVLFLAFADYFARHGGATPSERVFHAYCHAALLDSILQDKPQTLQTHLTLYVYRTMRPGDRFFHLRVQDLRFAADFYAKVFERRFGGKAEGVPRPPLVRDTTVLGALHALDVKLDEVRAEEGFRAMLGRYVHGEGLGGGAGETEAEEKARKERERHLAWYLLKNGVPVSTLLVILRELAKKAHAQCLGVAPPEGTADVERLDMGIREVLHGTGTKMTTALGSGWSVRSVNEIVQAWKEGEGG